MARYTQLDRQAMEEIASDYALGVDSYESIEGGAGNSSYHLKTGQGEYVLTVFDDKSHEHAMRTGKLLQQLEKYDIPSSQVMLTSKQQVITSFQGKPVMIKKYIHGDVCQDLDRQQLLQIGLTMARLHDVPAQGLLQNQHSYGLQMFSTITGCGISQEYEKWLAQKEGFISNQLPEDLTRGFIHGDLFYDNVLFGGDDLRAIIDFEEACFYYRAFDIGMGIVGLCSSADNINLFKARALVDGYQQARQLKVEEKEAMQMFTVYAATATSYWRFWKFNIHMPDASKRFHYRLMSQLADSIQKTSSDQFYRELFN